MKRFKGEKKPPRVYIDNGTFFISYWLSGHGEQRKSTGIRADVPFKPRTPDWWHTSKHASELQQKINIAEANRTAFQYGQPAILKDTTSRIPSLETILELKAKRYEDRNDEPLQKSTLYTYKRAIGALHSFNRYANILTVDVDDVRKFKKWLESKDYEDETKHLIIRQLRSLWKFAIEKGFIIPQIGIPPNPWTEIFIKVEPKLKVPQDIPTEKLFFTEAYKTNRKLFDFTFFQRITGYSFSDVLIITPEMRVGDLWHLRRTKMKRPQYFPDSIVMHYHLDHMPEYKPMFGYRNGQNVNRDSKEICNKISIPYLTTSDFKDSYAEELDGIVREDRILAMLLHHKVKGESQMASNRYLTHIKQMRSYLDSEELSHWLHFRKTLEGE